MVFGVLFCLCLLKEALALEPPNLALESLDEENLSLAAARTRIWYFCYAIKFISTLIRFTAIHYRCRYKRTAIAAAYGPQISFIAWMFLMMF